MILVDRCRVYPWREIEKETQSILLFPSRSSPTVGDWNCETCIADILKVSEAWQNPAAADQVVGYLRGAAFCQDPVRNFDEAGVEACRTYLDGFLPAAMPVLFRHIGDSAQPLCANWYDVC